MLESPSITDSLERNLNSEEPLEKKVKYHVPVAETFDIPDPFRNGKALFFQQAKINNICQFRVPKTHTCVGEITNPKKKKHEWNSFPCRAANFLSW